MSLRHTMLARGIVGRPLQGAKGSLTGHAAFKLPLHFLRGALFERVGATARDQPCDHEQDRHALHLLILESERGIARRLKR
jgi:hypothetical protein